MGDSSGGIPGPSGLSNLTDLLEKTKEKYQLFNLNDKRWPCPFCLSKQPSLFQCKIHIRHDHPSMVRADKNLLSQFLHEVSDEVIESTIDSNVSVKENITKYLDAITEAINNDTKKESVQDKTNGTFASNDFQENEDEEVFYCPYGCTRKNSFRNLRGLNIHIGKMHPEKKKIKRDEIEYIYVTDENAATTDFGITLANFKSTTATLRRCPKGARQDLAVTLTKVIRRVINENCENSWNDLLIFPYATLRIPDQSENVTNLTSFVRQNIKN